MKTQRPFQDYTEATLETAAPELRSTEERAAGFDEEEDLDRDTIPSPPPFL